MTQLTSTTLFLVFATLIVATESRATVFLEDNVTGGDCTLFGTWNTASRTCTLNSNIADSVQIISANLTLDCDDHRITPANGDDGVTIPDGSDGVTVTNCEVIQIGPFAAGILVFSNDSHMISNTVSAEWCAIDLIFGNDNEVSENTLIGVINPSFCPNFGCAPDEPFAFGMFSSDSGGHTIANNYIRDVDSGYFSFNGTGRHIFSENDIEASRFTIRMDDEEGDDIVIDSNTLTASRAIAVQGNGPFPGGPYTGSDFGKITNNEITLDTAGVGFGYGIFINTGINDWEISGNRIAGDGIGDGIVFDVGVERLLVSENVIKNTLHGISDGSGISAPSKDAIIRDNDIINSERPIYLLGDSGHIVEYNRISESGSVVLMDLTDSVFRNNDIKRGIEIGDKPGLPSFDGCATGNGCFLQMVVDCNLDAGVLVSGSRDIWLEGNRIDGSFGEGIRVEPLVREELKANRRNVDRCFGPPFERPPGTGKFDRLASENVTLISNIVTMNGRDGLKLLSADTTKVTQNDFYLNGGFPVFSDEAIELSDDDKGNWWQGNCSAGLFVAGIHSNDANVVDSHPYNGAIARNPNLNFPLVCP